MAPKRNALIAATALFAFTAPALAADDHGAHWTYGGSAGPGNWGKLKPEYSTCGAGVQQSPVDIAVSHSIDADLSEIEFFYRPTNLNVLNNGHTIQANYGEGSTITVNGDNYELLQFHFHTPSEHTLNGEAYDMEVHLVHKNAEGKLAVVGIFMEEGSANNALEPVWQNMPAKADITNKVASIKINGADLLPNDSSEYFHYKGSLTTPPCTESVSWYVLKTPTQVSAEQIEAFASLVQENARPTQPLHRRFVLGAE